MQIAPKRIQTKLIRHYCFLICVSGILGVTHPSTAQIKFTDETSNVGGPFHEGESWGASWGDINGDFYPDLFVSNHAFPNSILRNNGNGTFTDVIQQADADAVWIKEPDADIHGAAFADYDNDGDQDLIVSRSSRGFRMYLMENNGSGVFTDQTLNYEIPAITEGRMPILFDYNNDGFLDMAYTRNGDGIEFFEADPTAKKFTLKTTEVGLKNKCLLNVTGFISDIFDSGSPLYFCVPESGIPQHVYDTSTIPFTEVNDKIDKSGLLTDIVIADFNNDLKLDMFATRGRTRPSGGARISSKRIEAWVSTGRTDSQKSFTFKANGSIKAGIYARKVSKNNKIKIGANGYHPTSRPFSLDPKNQANWGVLSDRSELGIYIGYDKSSEQWVIHSSGLENGVKGDAAYFIIDGTGLTEPQFTGLRSSDFATEPRFLLNNGLRLVNAGANGIGAVNCNSVAAADFDNDMDVDLYLACRDAVGNIENLIYINDGSGQFTPSNDHGAEGQIGTGIQGGAGSAEIVVTADYDVDGYMDLFVTNGNHVFPHIIADGFSGGGIDNLFRNQTQNNNHWLQIDLEGTTVNKDAVGAKVIVTAAGVSQIREQNGMHHRWSHDSRRLHFGLGTNTQATVEVKWPDGSSKTYNSVNADSLYKLTQGNNELQKIVLGGNLQPTFNISRNIVNEGNNTSVIVSLFPAQPQTTTVRYSSVNDSAESGTDYTGINGTLTFAPGETEKVIQIETKQDVIDESNEFFSIELSNPSNNISLGQSQGMIEIKDDDAGAINAPVISITDTDVNEADGQATFTISLSKPSNDYIEVYYKSFNDSAKAPFDFVKRFGVLKFQPGQISKSRSVFIRQDEELESEESFIMRLIDPLNANILKPDGTVTIHDDEVRPTLRIDDIQIAENATLATLQLTVSEASTFPINVSFKTIADSATAGNDYISRNSIITIKPGTTTQLVAISLVNDNIDEGDEQFSVEISNANFADIMRSTARITIEDDDDMPNILLQDQSTSERNKTANITVSLSEPMSSIVSVKFVTLDGSAKSPSDYKQQSGNIQFAPGEIVKKIPIKINPDNIEEENESFSIMFSNPVNGNLVKSSMQVNIIDDDGPSVQIAPIIDLLLQE